MDSGQHLYTGYLAQYAAGGNGWECLVAGAIAVAPDVIGFAEKVKFAIQTRKFLGSLRLSDLKFILTLDNSKWNWYLLAHSKINEIISLSLGLLFSFIYLPVGLGFLGYSLHLFLDRYTHEIGKRWWKKRERLSFEVLAWAILCLIALYVNPIVPWLALLGVLWSGGIFGIQMSKD